MRDPDETQAAFAAALAGADLALAYHKERMAPLLERVSDFCDADTADFEAPLEPHDVPCVPAFRRAIRGAERALRYHESRMTPILTSLVTFGSLADDDDSDEKDGGSLLPLAPLALRAGG